MIQILFNKQNVFVLRDKPCEDYLKQLDRERGLKWTILRPGNFMENIVKGLQAVKTGSDTFVLANTQTPMIAAVDIGRSVAACLAAPDIDAHHGKFYELSGPDYVTGEDIARVLSKKLNREVKYAELPKASFARMPKEVAECFEYCLEHGRDAAPKTDDVLRLTGRHTTIEEFLDTQL